LMWVSALGTARKRPLLHVVDIGTHFSAAEFLGGESVESVCAAFVSCWAAVYCGMPDVMRCDSGRIFTSQK
jgi:hypothetical protein